MLTYEIKNLSKSYKKNRAVDAVSLQLQPGVYGLLGPNGAGKTTLIRCMLGLCRYEKGDLFFSDKDRNIGYLPQVFIPLNDLSVYEQMDYLAYTKNVHNNNTDKEIVFLLERFNLSEARNRRVGKLSGGMIRRVGIAQALLGDPGLIILDEPTAGLDPEERLRFKNVINSLRMEKKERIIIVSTHIVEDVEAMCDKLLILKDGRIIAQGTQNEIKEKAEGKVFFVDANHTEKEMYVEKIQELDGVLYNRVLTNDVCNGRIEKPTVEDGYLCVLKNI